VGCQRTVMAHGGHRCGADHSTTTNSGELSPGTASGTPVERGQRSGMR
jgi:hypothetical protein